MPLSILCPGCGAKLTVPDAAAGKTVTCPKCKAAMVVPAAADPGFEVVDDAPAPLAMAHPVPSKPKPAISRVVEDDEDDPPRRRPRRDDEDDEDDRPRKRLPAKKKKGIPVWVWLVGGSVAALLGLAVVGYVIFGRGGGLLGPSAPPGWTSVRDSNGGFRVFLPGQAHSIKFTVNGTQPDPNKSGHASHSDDREFWVYSIKAPDGYTPGATPDQLYEDLKRFEHDAGGAFMTLVEKNPVTLGGKSGLEVKVTEKPFQFPDDGKLDEHFRKVNVENREKAEKEGRRKIFYITSDGKRVYILWIETKGTFPDAATLKTLTDSFSFL